MSVHVTFPAALILDARVSHARRDRSFGRVEAVVELVVKPCAGQPARLFRIRTNVPATSDGTMRRRLLESAVRLMRSAPSVTGRAAA
ncbi:hypothetical protein [Anianabacter salinae]|uniref:hypothetical protein n=1 Tax=Anianabacter salinae TaxID=2851023 RepID=UPI00225E36B4|nr:hypothetical protein [Anianabacter salinae]MBV0913758.1 hypothetical protein [Anianabacter salinae]